MPLSTEQTTLLLQEYEVQQKERNIKGVCLHDMYLGYLPYEVM